MWQIQQVELHVTSQAPAINIVIETTRACAQSSSTVLEFYILVLGSQKVAMQPHRFLYMALYLIIRWDLHSNPPLTTSGKSVKSHVYNNGSQKIIILLTHFHKYKRAK